MIRLVKDFQEYQFIYYWIDNYDEKISPDLPTLTHAKEWLIQRKGARYCGPERRNRICDRRYESSSQRNNYTSKRSASKLGRRQSDAAFEVVIDLSKDKVRKLKEAV
jgi:hypothetical protein